MKQVLISCLIVLSFACVSTAESDEKKIENVCEFCEKATCPKFLTKHLSYMEKFHIRCDSTPMWVRNGGRVATIDIYGTHVVVTNKATYIPKKIKEKKEKPKKKNKTKTIIIVKQGCNFQPWHAHYSGRRGTPTSYHYHYPYMMPYMYSVSYNRIRYTPVRTGMTKWKSAKRHYSSYLDRSHCWRSASRLETSK